MGQLFWKIFCSLWLTLLITATIAGGLVWQHNKERIEQMGVIADSPRADVSVNAFAKMLREEGLSALEKAIERRNSKHYGVLPLLIINDAGDDILGRPVPRLIIDKARDAATNKQQKAVQQVSTPNGEQFLLFIPHRDLSTLRQENAHLRQVPLLRLLIALLGSLFFSLALAWYMTQPVRHLRQATNQFAAGKLGTRVLHKIGRRKDEIADLAKDFDHMAEQVERLVAGQKRLLDDVSHELRSPLARLQVAVEMIRQQPDKTNELMERIDKESQRLAALVGELLTLSRLEADVYDNEKDYFDINGLLQSIVDDAQFEAKSQNKRVAFNGLDEILINGSIELLRRAIENIVRNAVYHTPENTSVSIAIRHENNRITISVSDSGDGVDKDRLKDLFQPFVRINERKQNVKVPGYGLGLAIARQALEIHNGQIKAYNHEGGGLCIEMEFPAN